MEFPFPSTPQEAGSGILATFMSFEKGAGASTLACLCAIHNANKQGRENTVALVDFSTDSKVRSYMGLTSDVCPSSIMDVVGLTEPRQILNAGVRTHQGIYIIPGLIRQLDASLIDSRLCLKTGSFLKKNMALTLAVSDALPTTGWLTALISDVICVVVKPERRDMDLFRDGMDLLSRLGCSDRVKVILNQSGKPGAMNDMDSIKFFSPDAILPYHIDVFSACNRRTPAVPNKMKKLLEQICDYEAITPYRGETDAKSYSLIASLAARAGLIHEGFAEPDTENAHSRTEAIVPEEDYEQLYQHVQPIATQSLTFRETQPKTVRSPEVRSKFKTIVLKAIQDLEVHIEEPHIPHLAQQLFDDILGFGPLEKYFFDPDVNEIEVNNTTIKIERKGQNYIAPVSFKSTEKAIDMVRKMIEPMGRRIDLGVPRVDCRLFDGSRLKAQIAPIAVDGVLVSIRRFKQDIDAAGLVSRGAASRQMIDFFKQAIQAKLNIVVAGGTSSGKTTWLNCLASFISAEDSIITVEDPAELQLQHPDVRRLESRPPNLEGKGEVTLTDLIRDSLRMNPDRIILGEVRGPEAWEMLKCMNSGHPGSLCTIHSDSAYDAIARLSNMVSEGSTGLPHDAILDQLIRAVHLIVYVQRDETGRRRIDHVIEVIAPIKGSDGRTLDAQTNVLWQYSCEKNDWEWVADTFYFEKAFPNLRKEA